MTSETGTLSTTHDPAVDAPRPEDIICPPFDPDRTVWGNIPSRSNGSKSVARQRLAYVFDADPFVAMLAPAVRGSMIEGILMGLRTSGKVTDAISASSHTGVRTHVRVAIKIMPLGFLTADFIDYLISLVCFAIIPNPERDEWREPV